jgi:predicted nucleotide-binding protein (sugar kinase/HSP70/actin superfamily)
MNKGIPDIFAAMGVKTFFQDMLPCSEVEPTPIKPLLKELHWHYAAEIMKAAEVTAQKDGAYPVLVTSFKCSPDSFVIEYFKQLMEYHNKPYLVLQLDDHDSNVGYETRIEAAIRSFSNHFSSIKTGRPVSHALQLVPAGESELSDKTLVIPNWDNASLALVVANLRREGIDARLLEESDISIQKSLRHNTGQCIPLNIIAQEFMDFIEGHQLDPEKTVLWMVSSVIPCNLGLFPHYIKAILASQGNGLEKAGVYVGDMSFGDLSMKLPVDTYFAYMFGGFLKKMGCRIRPYETNKGETDAVIKESLAIFVDAFLGNRKKEDALEEVVSRFEGIARDDHLSDQKPKVAIFGDLYARDNEVINQGLIHKIEEHGGEVVTTPYSSYVKMIAKPYLRKWFVEGNYLHALFSKALMATVSRLEKRYLKFFNRILNDPEPLYNESPEEILSPYNIRIEHTGESMDNVLKLFYMMKHHPDISLFVQTSPAFCCPSLVTEAMAKEIERHTGVPIVSITYDGTRSDKNDVIIPYLKYPRQLLEGREHYKMS